MRRKFQAFLPCTKDGLPYELPLSSKCDSEVEANTQAYDSITTLYQNNGRREEKWSRVVTKEVV